MFVEVVQAKQHLHEKVDYEGLIEQLTGLLSLFDVYGEVTELAVLHYHDQNVVLQEVLFELEDVLVFEVLVDLHFLKGLLLLFGGHALEVDLLGDEGFFGGNVDGFVHTAVVPAAD